MQFRNEASSISATFAQNISSPLAALQLPTGGTRERKIINPPEEFQPFQQEKVSRCRAGGRGWFVVMGKGIPTRSRATQGGPGWERQLCSPSSPAKPVWPAGLLYPSNFSTKNPCPVLP